LRAWLRDLPVTIGVGGMTLMGMGMILLVLAFLPNLPSFSSTEGAPSGGRSAALPQASALSAPPFHVLILDGADPARPAAQALLREFSLRLNDGTGRRVEIFQENLDRRRFDDPAHLRGSLAWYEEKYRSIRLDAIVALEAVPTATALQLRAALGYRVPIISGFTSARSEGRAAEVLDAPDMSIVRAGDLEGELIRHISRLFPETRSIAVITDGAEAALHLAETVQRVSGGSLSSRPLTQLPMTALRDSLAALPSDAAVLYWSISRDGDGNTWIPSEALRAVADASVRPIFGTVDLLVGGGSFGGPSLSYGAFGRDLADQTRAVLEQEPGAAAAERTHDAWVWQYDWSLVRRFGVDQSGLHQPALFVGRPQPFWVSHPIQTGVAAVLLLMQLVTILALTRRNYALERARAELRGMSEDLIRAQDDERARIARDLHDDLCQEMSLLAIEMGTAPTRDSAAFASRVHYLVRRTQDIARGLHPGTVAMQDLRRAVESLAHPLGSSHGITIDVQSREWPAALDAPTTLGLFRIIQEALQNVVRHAGAQRCSVQLTGSTKMLRVVVKDDGVGLSLGNEPPRGLGLRSMQERARAMGGNVYLSSEPLRGTSVVVLLPHTGT
jgi:signal transduction histidine kinase